MQTIEGWFDDDSVKVDIIDIAVLSRKAAAAGTASFRRVLGTAFALRLCQEHRDVAVRSAATRALCLLLTNPDPDIRVTAANFLGQTRDPLALPSLLEVRPDDMREVRAAVDAAINAVRRR